MRVLRVAACVCLCGLLAAAPALCQQPRAAAGAASGPRHPLVGITSPTAGATVLASRARILDDPVAPVGPTPLDAAALVAALNELAAASPQPADADAFGTSYASYAAAADAAPAAAGGPTGGATRVSITEVAPQDSLLELEAAAPAPAAPAAAEADDAEGEADEEAADEAAAEDGPSGSTLAATARRATGTQPATYTLAVPVTFIGATTFPGKVTNATGVMNMPTANTAAQPTSLAVAPDGGPAGGGALVNGEGFRSAEFAAAVGASAPGAAPLFTSFQAQRLATGKGKGRGKAGKKKGKKGKGKNKKTGSAGAAGTEGAAAPRLYARPASAAMGIKALTSKQLKKRAESGAHVRPASARLPWSRAGAWLSGPLGVCPG